MTTMMWLWLLQVSAVAAVAAPVTSHIIERVGWLTGCWEQSSPDRTVEEHWLPPRGGTMINVGRTVRADSLFEYELVVLRERGERLAYEAHPSGQETATFLSRELSDTTAVFENPAHDFPQVVGYRLIGPDSLLAWIEGTRNGRVRRVEFPYRRTGCGAR